MKDKPKLLIMAAGMGSRYGGDKQIDPMTDQGEIIMDFSMYDAMLAGFEDVVIVTRKDMESAIRERLDNKAAKYLNIQYAFQDKEDTLGVNLQDSLSPEELKKIKERSKPWGTGHAVLAARDYIKGPFIVINSDDYYGSSAFQHIYDFLESSSDASDSKYHFAMVCYRLDMTLSESGYVSRGICSVSSNSMLEDITEKTRIERQDSGSPAYTEDDGATWNNLAPDTPVSMNFWGFSRDMMDELEKEFPAALLDIAHNNPDKGEYFLPFAVDKLLKSGSCDVKVLRSSDKWYGVTNPQDKASVKNALQSMKDKGLYPDILWK